jgi:hypothetical protein
MPAAMHFRGQMFPVAGCKDRRHRRELCKRRHVDRTTCQAPSQPGISAQVEYERLR